MQIKFTNSRFARLYLWMTKAKYTMGMFFVVYVFLYLIFGYIAFDTPMLLDLPTAIEMTFACFFVGLTQQIILPVDRLSKPRCLLWLATGTVITLVFSLTFRWFSPFPVWYLVLFLLVMLAGMAALLVSYYLELKSETRLLNKKLEQFQKITTPENSGQ